MRKTEVHADNAALILECAKRISSLSLRYLKEAETWKCYDTVSSSISSYLFRLTVAKCCCFDDLLKRQKRTPSSYFLPFSVIITMCCHWQPLITIAHIMLMKFVADFDEILVNIITLLGHVYVCYWNVSHFVLKFTCG